MWQVLKTADHWCSPSNFGLSYAAMKNMHKCNVLALQSCCCCIQKEYQWVPTSYQKLCLWPDFFEPFKMIVVKHLAGTHRFLFMTKIKTVTVAWQNVRTLKVHPFFCKPLHTKIKENYPSYKVQVIKGLEIISLDYYMNRSCLIASSQHILKHHPDISVAICLLNAIHEKERNQMFPWPCQGRHSDSWTW